MVNVWVRRLLWILAAAVAVGAAIWSLRPQPVEVDVATVARGPFHKTVDEDGKTRVRERYVVSAPLAGRLLRIALKPGDAVLPGALLATLVPSEPALLDARTEQELTERVGAAEARRMSTGASVERQRVAVKLAQSELDRLNQLGAQGFASRQALERTERDLELKTKDLAAAQFDDHAAEHELAMAHAALSRARRSSSGGSTGQRWEIRSPVAGRVLRVAQESEAVVAIGAALIELGDPMELEVVVDVLTTDAESIRPGTSVALDHGQGSAPLAGRVRLVEPAAFTKVSALGVEEQRVNVVIDFTARQARPDLGDGYRVDARIVVDQRDDALLVPTAALFRRDDQWAVFVAADGRAQQKTIHIGPRNGAQAVVTDGLDAGARVIVYPGEAVGDGVRVEPRRSR